MNIRLAKPGNWLSAAVLALTVASTSASGQVGMVQIADGDMHPLPWTVYNLQVGGGGTGELRWELLDGNPAHSGRIRTVVNPRAGEGAPSSVYAFAIRADTYNPRRSGAAILLLSYSEDLRFLGAGSGEAESTPPALRQNGKLYAVSGFSSVIPPTWTTLRFNNLTATNFVEYKLNNGQIQIDAASHPDFAGDSIQFGFLQVRTNNSTQTETHELGIDNWNFVLTTSASQVIAVADSYRTVDSRPYTVPAPGVLGNDINNTNAQLSAVLIRNPQFGTVQLAADGGFTYTPILGYVGMDDFEYQPGGVSSATVTINVVRRVECSISATINPSGDAFAQVILTSSDLGVASIPVLLEMLVGSSVINSQTRPTDQFGRANFNLLRQFAHLKASFQVNGQSSSCEGEMFFAPANPCVFGQLQSLGGSSSSSPIAELRRFRDDFLAREPSGRERIRQYYKHSPEVIRLLASDGNLLPRALSLYRKYQPIIGSLVAGGHPTVAVEQIKEMDEFLGRLEPRASKDLRAAIRDIRADMRDPRVLARLGIDSPTPAPREVLANMPLRFEQNRGQVGRPFDHVVKGARYEILLAANRLQFHAGSLAVTMKLVGADARGIAVGEQRLPATSNYLLGRDRASWLTNVPNFARVRYSGVYPGIDLVYYGREGRLEHDFVVAPEGDPRKISIRFDPAKPHIDEAGNLLLAGVDGELRLQKPVAYQDKAGRRINVPAQFRIDANESVSFEIAPYDRRTPLVIDPVLTYSSYLGGQSTDAVTAMAVGADGSIYLTGSTTSQDFPVLNPFQRNPAPGTGSDVFVTKLNAAGTSIIYSTYLGGADEDTPLGIAVDPQGSAYLTGATRSRDFPLLHPIQAVFGGAGAIWGTDAFVTKLDPSGASLVYSTYLGGADNDGARGIAVGSDGSVTVAGVTASANFPVANAMQTTLRGGATYHSDAFISKINAAGTALVYSTFLGGAGDDAATALALDFAGNVYVTGFTYSNDFPALRPLSATNGGGADVFVSKLRPDGSALLGSTYFGGEGDDLAFALALDRENTVHITGVTGSSAGFPRANAAQLNFGGAGGQDAFVARIDLDRSILVYSTPLGGNDFDMGFGLALDSDGNLYVTGVTRSTDFATGDVPYPRLSGSADSFLAKLDSSGKRFLFRSYLGGNGAETAQAIAASPAGAVYFAGSTTSANLPVTGGAVQSTAPLQMNGFLARMETSVTACTYAVSPGTVNLGAAAGSGSLTVNTGANCAWTAKSLQPWTTITPVAARIGPGTVNYTYTANTLTTPRSGGIGIADSATLTLSQASSANTQYQLTTSVVPANGGSVAPASGTSYAAGTIVNVVASPAAGFTFSNWSGPVANANLASTTVTMDTAKSIAANFAASTASGLQFVPVTPCRIADTRLAAGPFGGPALGAAAMRDFVIPQSNCGIPATAQAYSLNVTALPNGPLAYLSIWPTGQSQPLVSTLNSFQGFIVANAAIVPAGTNGAISIFATSATDVVIDINGYFALAGVSGGQQLYKLTPCRVADTRLPAGAFGGPSLAGGSTRSFQVSQSACGVPAAAAYAMNATVVPPGVLGFLTLWPTGQSQPLVSTLNSFQGYIVANAAIVPAGTGGAINAFATNATDLILDINGYFGAPGGAGGLNFYKVAPCRVTDTRLANGPFGGPALGAGTTRNFAVPQSTCAIPGTAQAYSVNITVAPPGPVAFLTAWPAGASQPVVSTLNSYQGSIVANAAIVPAGANGAVSIFVTSMTDVIIDINGYFAP